MAQKTVQNISQAPVLGNDPGEIFELEDGPQLKRMVERGSLKVVDPSEAPKAPEESSDSPDGDAKDGGKQVPPVKPLPVGKRG